MNELVFARVSENAKGPTREPDSIGYDVYAYGDHTINPSETKIIPLGFHAKLDEGYGAFVWDRSSLGSKGLHIFKQLISDENLFEQTVNIVPFGGCIDWSYRGQWGIILHNFTPKIFPLTHNQRVTQFVVQKCETPLIKEITMDAYLKLPPTIRGQGGLGSSDGQNTPETAQKQIVNAATPSTKKD